MRHLVVDTPNLLFRVHSVNQRMIATSSEEESAGLAMHMVFKSLLSYFKKFKPDRIAFAFEGRNNWRKEYTQSSQCVSQQKYKGNRVYTESSEHFFELVDQFKSFVREHTTAVCLNADRVEGDDLIAGYVQRYSKEPEDVIIVLSGDKDFVQLLKHKNVQLINPDKGKPRECDDPIFFMFEKCIRGDSGDNVMSAYPRVRSTRLQKAYADEFEMNNLMNETWAIKDPDTKEVIQEFVVRDLFEENKLLMDLEAQPQDIRELIETTIEEAIANRASYSYFHFMKFLGKHKLEQIANDSMRFNDLFSLHENQTKNKGGKKVNSLIQF